MNCRRHPHTLFHLMDAACGITERDTGRKIERQGHRGKLSLVVHGEGRRGWLVMGECA